MKDMKEIIISFGDIGIKVEYKPYPNGQGYFWHLAGQVTPERTLLQNILRSSYSEYIQDQLREVDRRNDE